MSRTLLTSPRTIDVSALPAPDAIETLDYEILNEAFKTRFLTEWDQARAEDPTLPAYDVEKWDSDPIMIAEQAWTWLRMMDRGRVNDAVRALLPAFSNGPDLDNLVAARNLQRLTVRPVTDNDPAVMETDAALLRRYLASFDAPAAGSPDGFIFRAATAWPEMHDMAVNAYAVHGRPGEVDIVVAGPDGRVPTTDELERVRAAVTASDAKQTATPVRVVAAGRQEYAVSLHLEIIRGADPTAVVASARERVLKAAAYLTRIDQEVPVWSVAGVAYSQNIIRVNDLSPASDIPADPYKIPVCTGVDITAEVRQ